MHTFLFLMVCFFACVYSRRAPRADTQGRLWAAFLRVAPPSITTGVHWNLVSVLNVDKNNYRVVQGRCYQKPR